MTTLEEWAIEACKRAGFKDASAISLLKSAIRLGYLPTMGNVEEVLTMAEAINVVAISDGLDANHMAYLAEALQYDNLRGLRQTARDHKDYHVKERANQILTAINAA